jgi:hypothetical protein
MLTFIQINELEDELRLAHSVRHDTTISSLALANDLDLAIQAKRSSEKHASDMSNKYVEIFDKHQKLVCAHETIREEYNAALVTNDKLQSKIQVGHIIMLANY